MKLFKSLRYLIVIVIYLALILYLDYYFQLHGVNRLIFIAFMALLPAVLTMLVFKFIFKPGSSGPTMNVDLTSEERLTDICGIEHIETEVKEIITYIKSLFDSKDSKAARFQNILITGDKGTGKTLLASVIAGESNVRLYKISANDFIVMCLESKGSSLEIMITLFNKAAPCILLVDNIAELEPLRNANPDNNLKESINLLLNDLLTKQIRPGLVFIAISENTNFMLPEFLGKDDFNIVLELKKPDFDTRKDILNLYTKNFKIEKDVDINHMAKITEGLSGAELSEIINKGILIAKNNNKKTLSLSDLEESSEQVLSQKQTTS